MLGTIILAIIIVGLVAWRFYDLLFEKMGVNKRYATTHIANHRILTRKKKKDDTEYETCFVLGHEGRDAMKTLYHWAVMLGVPTVVFLLLSIVYGWFFLDFVVSAGLLACFYFGFWQPCRVRNRERHAVAIFRKGEFLGFAENIDLLIIVFMQYETVRDPKVLGPQKIDQEMKWDLPVRNKSTQDPITVPQVDLSIFYSIGKFDPAHSYTQQPMYLAFIAYTSYRDLMDAVRIYVDGFTAMYFRSFKWEGLKTEIETKTGESDFTKGMFDALRKKFAGYGLVFVNVLIEGFQNPAPIEAVANAEFDGEAAYKKALGEKKAKITASEGEQKAFENVAAGHQAGLQMFADVIGDGARAAEAYINLGRQEADQEMAKSAKQLYMVPGAIEKLEIHTSESASGGAKPDKPDDKKAKK